MEYFYYILVCILGLCWGSFLTVIIWRIDDLKNIFRPRSYCSHCNNDIKWYDLIPLISYGILRGRCRKCKERISAVYPIIELLTGITFILTYIKFGMSWDMLIYLMIFSTMIITFGYDAIHMQIIDQVVYIGLIFVIILHVIHWNDYESIRVAATQLGLGLAIGLGLPLLLVIPSRATWMGEGDIWLGALIGLFVGYPNILVAYFIALFLGSVFGLIQVALKKKSLKNLIPFGPFMVVGAITAVFAGQYLLNLYVQLLNKI